MNDNLKTWDALGVTDKDYTKPIEGRGFKGTAINPTYCYRKMTERFGECGTGWKYEVKNSETYEAPDDQLLLYVHVELFVKTPAGWSDPIPGTGGDFIVKKNSKGLNGDDEAFKKATTDALTNAMKFLGMSADVHMGHYDDNKYIDGKKEDLKTDPLKNKALKDWLDIKIKALSDATDLDLLRKEYQLVIKHAKESGLDERQIELLTIQKDNTKKRLLAESGDEALDEQFKDKVGVR